MSPAEETTYYHWLQNDTTANHKYVPGEYVCYNFVMHSMTAARFSGFNKLYFCLISNYRGLGNNLNHAAITALVNGNNTTTLGGKKVRLINGFIIFDPQNHQILNDELLDDGFRETILIMPQEAALVMDDAKMYIPKSKIVATFAV